MLNCRWLASIKRRRASIPLGNFFFEPLQLHLEPADLLVQLGHLRLRFPPGPPFARSREQRLQAVQGLPLPRVNLRGMNSKTTRQLTDRVSLFDRRQRHLGFEASTVN